MKIRRDVGDCRCDDGHAQSLETFSRFTPSRLPSRVRLITKMFAVRDERDYCVQEDFMKAVRKMAEAK